MNRLVPIKYPILSGMNTMPNFHLGGRISLINHIGRNDSNNDIVTVDIDMITVKKKLESKFKIQKKRD